MEESEGLAQELRSISGVEYSAVLKEYGPKAVRVSLRAKREGDVSKIAARLGGGGHIKAAGCTLNTDLKDVYKRQSRYSTCSRELMPSPIL